MILIVNCGSNKTPFIGEIVNDTCGYKTISMYDFGKTDLSLYDGIIISGAPILLSKVNPEPYLIGFEKLKDTNLPILGICFGHQIIGLLHEAHISLQPEDRDWQTIGFSEESELLKSMPKECLMMEDHCEMISIPRNFKLIGSSDKCINEAMEHREKKIFGVQFHPEVSGNMGARLIENFCNLAIRK